MKFSELVRLLEAEGFRLVKHKGSVRYYGKAEVDRLIRVDAGLSPRHRIDSRAIPLLFRADMVREDRPPPRATSRFGVGTKVPAFVSWASSGVLAVQNAAGYRLGLSLDRWRSSQRRLR